MNNQPITFSVASMNTKIKSRFHLYIILSQKYHLLAFSSGAITAAYYKHIAYIRTQSFGPNAMILILHLSSQNMSMPEIFHAIETQLEEKRLPHLGLDSECLPEIEWLVGVYFFLSPNDEDLE